MLLFAALFISAAIFSAAYATFVSNSFKSALRTSASSLRRKSSSIFGFFFEASSEMTPPSNSAIRSASCSLLLAFD
jgi:hypothetical protein